MEHNVAATQGWFNPYRVLPDPWTHLAAVAASGQSLGTSEVVSNRRRNRKSRIRFNYVNDFERQLEKQLSQNNLEVSLTQRKTTIKRKF
jgi:hypothetical protein